MAHRGQLYDAFQAKASGAEALAWCRRYKVATSARFSAQMYGDEMAGLLSRWWAAKMQHFLDIYRARGVEKYLYTDADVAGFVEPPEVPAMEAKADGKQRPRFAQVRALRP